MNQPSRETPAIQVSQHCEEIQEEVSEPCQIRKPNTKSEPEERRSPAMESEPTKKRNPVMTSEPVSLRMKRLADQASKVLKEYKLSRKEKVLCKEIIRNYEKHRATEALLELKK
jgi:hypothetical protein